MVAIECLVPSVAGQRADEAALANSVRNPVGWHQTGVGKRLIKVVQEMQNGISGNRPFPEIDRMMTRPEMFGHGKSKGGLVMVFVGEAHIKGRRRFSCRMSVRSHDERGINPSAQQGCHGHVGYSLAFHGLPQRFGDRLDRIEQSPSKAWLCCYAVE